MSWVMGDLAGHWVVQVDGPEDALRGGLIGEYGQMGCEGLLSSMCVMRLWVSLRGARPDMGMSR